MKKRILSILLLVLMVLTLVPQTLIFSSAAVIEKGDCGENIKYTIDDMYTLTISGKGDMPELKWYNSPWYNKKESIKTVVIENGVTSIGYSAFSGCTSLTGITIPDSVISIESSAFSGCTSLKSITIPGSVTSIGQFTFRDCTALTDIIIPTKVTNIGDSAFTGCTSLTDITIPEGVTSIDNSAFRGCTSLTDITIPAGVTSIGFYAFEGCTSLANITIPAGVTSIGNCAFSSCTSLSDITVDINNKNYASYEGVLFNKDKTQLLIYPQGKTDTEYRIPKGVTSIDNSAFSSCTSLTDITIPDSVTSIGNAAFYGCTALTDITIPEGVTEIGISAFSGCTSLTGITVNANNKDYESYEGILFYKDKKALILYPQGKTDTEYTIPEGVIKIGNYAFYGCTFLRSIQFPESLTNIGEFTFQDCTALTDITIPEGVTSIGQLTFAHCTALTDIIIPTKVTNIGAVAFFDCSSLTGIEIPDSVTSIGWHTFENCTSLTDVYYKGSKEQWKNIDISSGNMPLLKAEIHFNYVEHMHSFGEWVITKKATYSEAGLKERKCACGETETAVIPVLKAEKEIKAENTGVSLKYDNAVLDENVKLNVSEKYDGGAFDVINTEKGSFNNKVFDINLTGSKGEVQPEGFVLVGIPLPGGYKAENTVVYYVSEEDNSLTKMNSYVKDGIIWFETDHFSAYAVVDETKNLPGDMDGDGKLTAADARTVLRASVKLDKLSNAQNAAADVDKDKKITAADARIILRRSVGLSD